MELLLSSIFLCLIVGCKLPLETHTQTHTYTIYIPLLLFFFFFSHKVFATRSLVSFVLLQAVLAPQENTGKVGGWKRTDKICFAQRKQKMLQEILEEHRYKTLLEA